MAPLKYIETTSTIVRSIFAVGAGTRMKYAGGDGHLSRIICPFKILYPFHFDDFTASSTSVPHCVPSALLPHLGYATPSAVVEFESCSQICPIAVQMSVGDFKPQPAAKL
jgi:hypothetical protein